MLFECLITLLLQLGGVRRFCHSSKKARYRCTRFETIDGRYQVTNAIDYLFNKDKSNCIETSEVRSHEKTRRAATVIGRSLTGGS